MAKCCDLYIFDNRVIKQKSNLKMITNWIQLGLVAVLLIGFIDGDDEGELVTLTASSVCNICALD